MYPVFDAIPTVPAGAPVKKTSLKFTRGKISTGGNAVPVALMMPQRVMDSPLSADTILPTCFLPVGAID